MKALRRAASRLEAGLSETTRGQLSWRCSGAYRERFQMGRNPRNSISCRCAQMVSMTQDRLVQKLTGGERGGGSTGG